MSEIQFLGNGASRVTSGEGPWFGPRPGPTFESKRRAQLHDPLDRGRADLDAYVLLTEKLRARSVLDVARGTGAFA